MASEDTTKDAPESKATTKKMKAAEAAPVATETPTLKARWSALAGARGWKRAVTMGLVAVLAAIVVIVAVFGVLIYAYHSDNPAVKLAAAAIPYPAERVNGQFVSYNDYLFEVGANERAYQNNAKLNNQPAVDFNSATGKKLVTQIKQHSLQTLQMDALVAQLGKQEHVKVSEKDVNNLVNQLYERYGGQATLLKTLNQIYGWNLGDLKKVVYKQLLQQDVQNAVTTGPAAAEAKAKAQDLLTKLKGGTDFATLAKQESQATDAANGGDMGTFTKTQVPADVWAAVSALQPAQVSDVVKVSDGYAIYKVTTKNADGSIQAQEILVKTLDFNSYMQDQLKKAKVNVYVKA